MENVPTIITRADEFHADTIWGVALVKVLFPGFQDSVVLKQSGFIHPEQYVSADEYTKTTIVVDTGGVYDPELQMYDDAGAKSLFKLDGSNYSTAGLLWKMLRTPTDLTYSCAKVSVLDEIIRNVDDAEYKSPKAGWHFSEIIKHCNPHDVTKTKERDNRFDKLCRLTEDSLRALLSGEMYSLAEVVDAILKDSAVTDFLGEKDEILYESAARVENLIIARSKYSVATLLFRHVLISENHEPAIVKTAASRPSDLMFCIHPHGAGTWILESIPVTSDSTNMRKKFPEAWANMQPSEIESALNLPAGLMYVDTSCTYSVHRNFDSACALANFLVSTKFNG